MDNIFKAHLNNLCDNQFQTGFRKQLVMLLLIYSLRYKQLYWFINKIIYFNQ